MSDVKVNTTGQLRTFLAKAMIAVQNGDMDIDKASRITKIAGQINENMYAEIKVAKIRAEAGMEMSAFGSVELGDASEES